MQRRPTPTELVNVSIKLHRNINFLVVRVLCVENPSDHAVGGKVCTNGVGAN